MAGAGDGVVAGGKPCPSPVAPAGTPICIVPIGGNSEKGAGAGVGVGSGVDPGAAATGGGVSGVKGVGVGFGVVGLVGWLSITNFILA